MNKRGLENLSATLTQEFVNSVKMLTMDKLAENIKDGKLTIEAGFCVLAYHLSLHERRIWFSISNTKLRRKDSLENYESAVADLGNF
jgi:hypothetical protein